MTRTPLVSAREGAGRQGRRHQLPLGELHYAFSRHAAPALTVEAGDTVVVETEDAFSGQIRTKGDRRDRSSVPYSNPVSGCDLHLGEPLEDQTRVCRIEDGRILWDGRRTIPYAPMIGCIGTAPAIGSPTCFPAGDYGGNIDLRNLTAWATVYLPVSVPEGLFDLARERHLPGLRFESADEIGAVGVGRSMEEGIATAYSRLALWLEEDYGWKRWEAYSLLTQVGRLSLGFTCNGIAAARVPKEYAAE